MRIIAGAHGSGKTYETIHAAAADPDGYYVCEDYRQLKFQSEEYADVIPKDRMLTYKQVPDETKAPLNLYVDGMRHGQEIPSLWYTHHNLVTLAVSSKYAEENLHLSDKYIQTVRDHFAMKRNT